MASKPQLRFFWAAWYDKPYPDRTADVFAQFDLETGRENYFRDVDQTRVKSMVFMPFAPPFAELINNHPESSTSAIPMPLPTYAIHLRDNQRLIIFRRNFIRYGLYPVEQHLESMGNEILYVLGWQTTENILVNGKPQEKNIKSMMFIHENGSVEMTDEYDYGSAKWQQPIREA